MENDAFKLAGIKNLMRTNYQVPTDIINLTDEIDFTLSMSENWSNIKEKVLLLCDKPHKELFN